MPAASTSTSTAAALTPVVNGRLVKAEPQEGSLPIPPSAPKQKRRRASTPPAQPVASTSYAGENGYGADAFGYQPNALLPSFFRVEPYDEMQKRIGNWIWAMSKGHQHIHIEAKIGQIKHPEIQRRLQAMPFETEAILRPSAGPQDPIGLRYVFDSDMPAAQHKHFNRLLNFEVQETRLSPLPIQYAHAFEDDIFRKAGTKKVRIRKDQKTQAVIQVCEKVRLGDLNVFCPMSKFDWRLSISTEKPLPTMPDGPDLNMRKKDRLSYQHQVVQIDLTQVITATAQGDKRRHELDVEIVNADLMLAEAAAAEREENNCYEQLVGVLLSTVRLLIRNAQ